MPIVPIGSTGPIGAICLNELLPMGPIGSAGSIGAICTNEFMPIGPIGSIGPIGAICPIDANWVNMFHRPNRRDMYFICQLGQLVPGAQSVRCVSMNYCQLGPIGFICPIGAICTIDANWANWFHGTNWCDLSH